MQPTSSQFETDNRFLQSANSTATAPRKTISRSLFLLILIITFIFLSTCKKSNQPNNKINTKANDHAADTTTATTPPMRIVSLSPALTDMLIDLGMEPYIVGRDAWDERLDNSIPRVGDLSNLDLEKIILLKPTHLILQQGSQHIPQSLNNTAQKQRWTIINLHIDSLNDLFTALHQLTKKMTAALHDDQQKSRILQNEKSLIERFNIAAAPLDNKTRTMIGTVLVLYSINPPAAFGPNSYLSDIISKMGITNALNTGSAWRNLDAESILRTNPQTILLIKAGPIENTGNNSDLQPLLTLPIRAVQQNQLITISQPQALLPGTSIIKLTEQIRNAFINMNNPSQPTNPKKDPSR